MVGVKQPISGLFAPVFTILLMWMFFAIQLQKNGVAINLYRIFTSHRPI
ncbi:MAG: hypothetical protein RLZZ419_431 [Pseudomonadota bacterium]|jgi:hypothetical protein